MSAKGQSTPDIGSCAWGGCSSFGSMWRFKTNITCVSFWLHNRYGKREGWVLKYEKRLLLIWIHHFDSDEINNMDHMRISGT